MPEPIDFGNGLTLTVVGPMQAEVDALQTEHDKWVQANPDKVKALASYDDDSVFNLSSIVVLAEADVEPDVRKTILFAGDARGDKILEGLELAGLIENGGSIHVDILKGPHHGSDNNVTPHHLLDRAAAPPHPQTFLTDRGRDRDTYV